LNNKLHITGTYFYTRLQRVIAFDSSGAINPVTDPFGRFFGYLNTRGGFSRGVELSVQWALGRGLTVSGAYTYTDAREETPLIPAVYRSFITPEHQFTTFAVQRIGKRVFIDFALNASSSYLTELFNADFAGVAYRFSGQKRADLGASYRIPLSESKGIRLFAKMQNIFDQTYYEGGFLTPGATARGGLQFEF
jgi:outer membrane receptor protein involved in Fe transport